MAKILQIAKMGEEVLKQKCEEVRDPTAPEIQKLIDDMIYTANHIICTGLAAPQIFVPVRILLFEIRQVTTHPLYKLTPEYDPNGVPQTILINPTIEILNDEMEEGWEACLSLPDLVGRVKRYKAIRYSYQDRDGEKHTVDARGFHAVALQHECDHLDGILYPERINDLKNLAYRDLVLREIARKNFTKK